MLLGIELEKELELEKDAPTELRRYVGSEPKVPYFLSRTVSEPKPSPRNAAWRLGPEVARRV